MTDDFHSPEGLADELSKSYDFFFVGIACFDSRKVHPVPFTGLLSNLGVTLVSCKDGAVWKWFLTGAGLQENSVGDIGHGCW